jgi:pimeloyl-ACP methyl ester carboxylesterase
MRATLPAAASAWPPPDSWLRDHARRHFVEADGARLHVVEAGAGRPIILVHGFPDFWYVWRCQAPGLVAAGHRVIMPDLRGFNLSSKPAHVDAYTPSVLAADIAAVARHFGATDATLVAHDWGGIAAWHAAMSRPPWLRRLVILNSPHPVAFLEGLRRFRQLRRSWYIFYFQLPWLPEALLRRGHAATLVSILETNPTRAGAFSREDIAYHVHAHLQPGALTAALNCYRAGVRGRRRGFAGPATPVDVPTLVLWGDADRYLESWLADPPAALVPDCAVRHFPGASHWVMIDRPDEVTAAIVEHSA